MYKIIHGLTGIDRSIFTLRDTFPTTRGHQYKLFKHPVCYNTRVVNMWNALPSDTVEAPLINTFKSLLDKHWNNGIS